ncbi:TIGR03086 family metal-binding protein [Nocardia sp. NPDC004068]|uniref:TIGR03086 family metal-binding protein n=1 Tax=Nocardia sp. NPDC004068 TaxID=3364303 RepID=UPI0036AC2925
MFDLEPAATELESVLAAITDDQLDATTPCDGISVRALLAHVEMLTEAFRQAATKESVGRSQAPRVGDDDTALSPDWRTLIPARLKALAAAWRDPAAWQGDTEAGGVTMPAEPMAKVALNELVVHAWDLATATHTPYHPTPADITLLLDFLADTPAEGVPGMFAPVVPLPPTAPPLSQLLARTGRNPN